MVLFFSKCNLILFFTPEELISFKKIFSPIFNLSPSLGPILALTKVEILPLTSFNLKPPATERYPYAESIVERMSILSPS